MFDVVAFWTLWIVGAAGALRRGGPADRLGAALLAGGWVAGWLADGHAWARMASDLVVLLVLARLAWRSPTNWPVAACACQAVAVAASLAYGLQPDVGEETWARAVSLLALGPPLALALSLWRRPA